MNNNELHKIAPTLSKLKEKGTGFTVPKGYFNEIDEKMISEATITSLLKNSNSKQFKTPKNYFDEIESTVLAKLKAESLQIKDTKKVPQEYFNTIENKVFAKLNSEKKESKVISLVQKVKNAIIPVAIAASFAIVFTLFNQNQEITIDTIASADIENWIENGEAELDSYQLATIYNDIEIEDNFLSEVFTDNELEEYLNIEDIEQLILEN